MFSLNGYSLLNLISVRKHTLGIFSYGDSKERFRIVQTEVKPRKSKLAWVCARSGNETLNAFESDNGETILEINGLYLRIPLSAESFDPNVHKEHPDNLFLDIATALNKKKKYEYARYLIHAVSFSY